MAGRGKKALTPADIADVHALIAKGYQRKHIAPLFGVHVGTIYKALREPYAPELALMPKGTRAFRLNWNQRVIWAADPISIPSGSAIPL